MFITDHVIPTLPVRQGRDRRQLLTYAELLCLAAAQYLLQADASEPRWIRYTRTRLASIFPSDPDATNCESGCVQSRETIKRSNLAG